MIEIESLMLAYRGMSYCDAYNMPIPIRRWFISKFNKRQEEEDKKSGRDDTTKPLSDANKQMVHQQYGQNGQNKSKMSNFMGPAKK